MIQRVLVVSENGAVRESLADAVRRRGHQVTLAADGDEATLVAKSVAIDVALVEARRLDGKVRKLGERLKAERPGCRVATVSSFGAIRTSTDLLQFGSTDYLVDVDELLSAIDSSDGRTSERTQDDPRVRALVEVLDVVVGLLDLGDPHFGGSTHQAVRLARAVAEELGASSETVDEVAVATLLRDIGKVGLDRVDLGDPRDFDRATRERVREHVGASLRLIEHVEFPWKVLPVVRHHHERYDGKGYPDGLRGRAIPLGARIVAAVDAWVAMTSSRPHRPARSTAEAITELEREAGRQCDPEVVEALLRVVESTDARVASTSDAPILVVDPDESYRTHLEMRLKSSGLDVECVASSDAALERILDNPPTLVVADVEAEDGAAFELLQELRKDATLAALPFVCLDSYPDRIRRVRAYRLGVDDYVEKGVELEELAARLTNVVTRERARRGAGPSQRRGIRGELEHMGLPDIVQTLSIGMKTARVRIEADGRTGRVWFRDGAIVHAQIGPRVGEEAFFEIATWSSGRFVIEHGVRSRKSTIENDPMFLIMEAMRRIDERAADREASA